MYIRRKVFSLLQDETGEERYFSTTDVTLENEEERTFSVALNKLARKHSGSLDTKTKLAVDRVKVADGKMTKEEFAKKWRSKK